MRTEIFQLKKVFYLLMWCFFISTIAATPQWAMAQPPPEPLVAIHVSELTQALEAIPVTSVNPSIPTGAGFTGFQWWYTSWHYFVAHESMKETLRSDGTPFVEISDSDIASGKLRYSDGSPRYPILISLASEAIADNAIAPLSAYVSAGGFLVSGSSSFTRRPDGTYRGNFALATEMGVRMANSTPLESNNWNWYENKHLTKTVNHRLASHIPSGTLIWNSPMTSEEIPWGVSPAHTIHSAHYVWQVAANGATVIANGDSGPILTVNNYGQGRVVYHGAMQPLIGHGMIDPSMYSYLVYRRAIEWAFESFGLPIVKLSPWKYPYDAALVVRHDFEEYVDLIKQIKTSAATEHSLGVTGDYYFCTGALRTYTGADKASIISSLRDAVLMYGSTIGSHNGGLKNPGNLSLSPSDHDYWHWGPDEALDLKPTGYASGAAYASASILKSYQDIEGWLQGLDNGRSGCGTSGSCPRIWAAPYFNSTREQSYALLDQLGSTIMGEQKIGPFPHFTVSYQNPGARNFSHVSQPTSDWFVGTEIPQALEWGHTVESLRAAVDFYYNIGGLLLNYYGHVPSSINGELVQEYVKYSMTKPRIWPTNGIGIHDWWQDRAAATVTPTFTTSGSMAVATASISGSINAETAIELVLPVKSSAVFASLQVYLDGEQADSTAYRTTADGVKVRVGSTVRAVQVQYPLSASSVVPILTAITVNPTSVIGGSSSQGTVTISAQAPSGGVVVALSDNSTSSGVPASVTIAAGSTSATFTISTTPVTSTRTVTISAAYGGVTKTATLALTVAVIKPALSSLSISPTSVTGGSTSRGTVRLSAPAPSGGVVVSLSDNSSAASVPASVTVASGSSSAQFTITTTRVSSSRTVTVSAVYGGVTKTATLRVNR